MKKDVLQHPSFLLGGYPGLGNKGECVIIKVC